VARSATSATSSDETRSSASSPSTAWNPPPKRGKTLPWKTFLKAHFGVIAATDFFTVEVLTFGGLVRYVVWFVIDLESRHVHIAGLTRRPRDAWIQQVARNLTDSVDGFLRDKRYLIHDRDPLFTEAFRAILRATGIKCLKVPSSEIRAARCSSRILAKVFATAGGFQRNATASSGIHPGASPREGCSASTTNGFSIAPHGRAPRSASRCSVSIAVLVNCPV
jgi:hypothetical protein